MQDPKIQSVIALVAQTLKIPENDLAPDSSMLNTPPWDSVEHLNICLAFEQRFRTSLDVHAISNAISIRSLAELIPQAPGGVKRVI